VADENKVLVQFGVKLDELFSGLSQANSAVKTQTDEMKSSLDGLAGGFGQLKTALIGFSVILGGGSLFAGGVAAAKEMSGEAVSLSKALGISSEEASKLNVAIKSVGISADTYAGVNMRLTRQLKSNEEGLKAMGVVTRDANGDLLNGQAIMSSAVEALKGYKEGTDRNLAAQALFGRGAAEATALMKLNNEVMENAKVKAEELGLVIGPQQAGEMKVYKEAMEQVGLVMDGIQNAIGRALIPVLTELAEMFASTGPARVKVMAVVMENLADIFRIVINTAIDLKDIVADCFSAIGDAIGGGAGRGITAMQFLANVFAVVKIAALGLELGLTMAFEGISEAIEITVAYLKMFSNIAYNAMTLNFSGVKAAWTQGTNDIESILSASGNRIMKKAAEIGDAIAKAANGESNKNGPKFDAKPLDTKGKHYEDKSAKDATPGKEKSAVGGWEIENRLAKDHYELENNLETRSLSMDVVFWQSKVAHAQVANGDKLKVEEKLSAAILAVRKKSAADDKAMTDEEISADEKADLNRIELVKDGYDKDLALGKITKAQMLVAEAAYEEQKFQIATAAQQLRIKLMASDPNSSAVALQKEKDKMLAIEQAYALKKAGIEKAAAVEDNKYQTEFFKGMESGMANLLQGIATGTVKMSDIFKSAFDMILQAFAQVASKMLAEWAITQIKELIDGKATALSLTTANAGVAGSAAVASTAAIPIVGPALAPAAGAAAFAAAMAFAPSISASMGYDIPSNVNPVVQAHASEMILPAKYADVIRNLADQDGGQGGGAGTVVMNITTPDADSFRRSQRQIERAQALAFRR
jgi:hypothetical protein